MLQRGLTQQTSASLFAPSLHGNELQVLHRTQPTVLAGPEQAERERRRVQALPAQIVHDGLHAGGVRHCRVRKRSASRLGWIDAGFTSHAVQLLRRS